MFIRFMEPVNFTSRDKLVIVYDGELIKSVAIKRKGMKREPIKYEQENQSGRQ